MNGDRFTYKREINTKASINGQIEYGKWIRKLIIEGATGLKISNDVISTWNEQESLENQTKEENKVLSWQKDIRETLNKIK